MVLKVVDTIKDSYSTLFHNRTVLVYVIITAVISAILAGTITAAAGISLGVAASASITTLLASLPLLAAIMVVGFLISVFFAGAVLTAANSKWKGGMGNAARNSASRYLSLLGADVLASVIIAVPFLVFYIFGLMSMLASVASTNVLPTIIGLVLMLIGMILLAVLGIRFSISLVGAVNGKMRAVESVKHSWSATRGSFWRILAVYLVIGIITLVIGEGLVYALTAVGLSILGYFILAVLEGAGSVAMVRIYEALPG